VTSCIGASARIGCGCARSELKDEGDGAITTL